MLTQWLARRRDRRAREWLRHQMHQRQMDHVFRMIHEEYTRVYYEDNIPTRLDFLHELVDRHCPKP